MLFCKALLISLVRLGETHGERGTLAVPSVSLPHTPYDQRRDSKTVIMPEKKASGTNEPIDQQIRVFLSLFRGRSDSYGRENDRGGMRVPGPVNARVLKDHLDGKQRIGVYPLSPDIMGGSGVFWCVVDIDQDNIDLAIHIADSLLQLGVKCYVERSKSKGYHVWVFFSEPVAAYKARSLLQYTLDDVRKETGDKSLEVFPKQATIKQERGYIYGNYVYMPLFGSDVENNKTVFLNPDNAYEPCPDQWGFLESFERMAPEKINDLVAVGEVKLREHVPVSEETELPDTGDYSDMLPCVSRMMGGVGEGCRDEVAFALAKHWRVEKDLPEGATLAILQAWNLKNAPPLDAKTIEEKVASAYRGRGGAGYTSYGCNNPLLEPFCDKESCPIFKEHRKTQAAQPKEKSSPYFRKNTFLPPRLADEFMDRYSFIYVGGQLYIYRHGVYNPIGEEFIRSQCRNKLGDDATINRVNEVIAHIQDLTHLDADQLNINNALVNVKNGMLAWRTGELLPHGEEYLSTMRIPIEYNPQAKCPAVLNFFVTTLPPDCIELVEELFGYCLIPDVRYEKAFMLKGPGQNGKGTLLNLLTAFIGNDNISKVTLQDLVEHRFMRAEIFGKLVNLFADLDAHALKSTSYFKTVVSGDSITAERKHCDPFDFRPFARLIYSANEIPLSQDRSVAFYRRWAIIEFPNAFIKGQNAIGDLIARLTQENELSGLLNYALKGLKRLFEAGRFSEPESTKQALEDYQKASDTVVAFLSDRCTIDETGTTERKVLYDTYLQYCNGEGYKPESRPTCYARVKAQGVGERRLSKERLFVGVKLTNRRMI